MKKLISIFVIFLLFFNSNNSFAQLAQDKPIGAAGIKMTQQHLLDNNEIFRDNYHHYQVDQSDVSSLKNINQPTEIVVLFGTWCGDSIREVPKLLKLLDSAKNKNLHLTLIAVNTKKQADDKYQLLYTPTIIIRQNHTELGRIIETPKVSLSKDIVEFIK